MEVKFIKFKIVEEGTSLLKVPKTMYVAVSQIKDIKIVGESADVFLLDSPDHFPHFTAVADDNLYRALDRLTDVPIFVYNKETN